MTESIIDKIFSEGIIYSEEMGREDSIMEDLSTNKSDKEQDLLQTLSVNQRKVFDEYVEASFKYDSYYNDQVFRQGVSLGVRFTAEAFLLEK
ncbi:MAG: hypothetical protein IJE43_12105 [Alphaproteobacteria bacterium]|nr:hypothetical protein [Alphaproteobacteria bacterium]